MEQKQYMAPLWLQYPGLERGSEQWRSGDASAYLSQYGKWLDGLSPREREAYEDLFPEPVTWSGWRNGTDTVEYLAEGNLRLPLWRPQGEPKYSRNTLSTDADTSFCLFFHPLQNRGLQKGCFSQWWMSDFTFEGETFCCMEQYMMSGKARAFQDPDMDRQILDCRDPKKIKGLGRRVKNFDGAVWDRVKYSLVLNGNWRKFSQNPELRAFLLATGDSVLAEASPFDSIWGIHLGESAPQARDPALWRGRNLLGFALMEVRDELRRVYANASLCGMEA